MAYPIADKLVVAIASSALFDLSESGKVFAEQGEAAYRQHQRGNENVPLTPGVAFPFIRRLLKLNLDPAHQELAPVEVILLSNNDPDTGLRVFNSIEHHGLPITRAAFVSGTDPQRYIEPFGACLFLSANPTNVEKAIMAGYPAGTVLDSTYTDDVSDEELRIAFDFDGVLADDEAETVFQVDGLESFQQSELEKAAIPHNPGPLKILLEMIAVIQAREMERERTVAGYRRKVRTAIITSRNAPAHKRFVTTLRAWGIQVDETFFLGGMDKNVILAEFRPHIFFDDQKAHAGPASGIVPAVHVPFGKINMVAVVP